MDINVLSAQREKELDGTRKSDAAFVVLFMSASRIFPRDRLRCFMYRYRAHNIVSTSLLYSAAHSTRIGYSNTKMVILSCLCAHRDTRVTNTELRTVCLFQSCFSSRCKYDVFSILAVLMHTSCYIKRLHFEACNAITARVSVLTIDRRYDPVLVH